MGWLIEMVWFWYSPARIITTSPALDAVTWVWIFFPSSTTRLAPQIDMLERKRYERTLIFTISFFMSQRCSTFKWINNQNWPKNISEKIKFITTFFNFFLNLRFRFHERGNNSEIAKTSEILYQKKYVARMAELVDAPDSKSGSREGVRVRPPLRVPYSTHFL